MARLLSCAFTERPVVDRVTTVTRRRGWTFLTPGDRLTLCRTVRGRRPGEPLVRIAEVQVVRVRRERLGDITADVLAREGFVERRWGIRRGGRFPGIVGADGSWCVLGWVCCW